MSQSNIKDFLPPKTGSKDYTLSPEGEEDRQDDSQGSGQSHWDCQKGGQSPEDAGISQGQSDLQDAGPRGVGDARTGEPPGFLFDLLQRQQQMLADIALQWGEPSRKRVAVEVHDTPSAQKLARVDEEEAKGDEEDDLERQFEQFGKDQDEEQGSEAEDTDMYDEVLKFFDKEEHLGDPVSETTVNLVKAALRAPTSQSKQKEMLDGVFRPQNCDALQVPRTNNQIWRNMQSKTRDNDMEYQRIQSMLHKGMTPLLKLLDESKQKKDFPAVHLCLDTFKILAMTSRHITQRRREAILPDLAPIYRQLGAVTKPITTNLFGDDLVKEVKEIREGQTLSLKKNTYGKGVKPKNASFSGRGRGKASGRGSFQGGRQEFFARGKNFNRKRSPQPGKQAAAASQGAAPGQPTVSECSNLSIQLQTLKNSVQNFRAGKITESLNRWRNVTSDREILGWVKGICIDFEGNVVKDKYPKLLTLVRSKRV